MFEKWRKRRGEERTLDIWPTWSLPGAMAPESALAVADVWASVKLLSDSAAALPLIAYRRTDDGRKRQSSGRLAALLGQPAPATSQANLVSTAVAHLALWGNAFVGKFRDENGQLEQLALLHPDRVRVELVSGVPRYTVYGPKGERSQHGPDDIVHVKALSTDGLVGLSPIRQCRVALSLASNLGEHAQAFFENGARPTGILKLGGAATDAQVTSLREQLTSRHVGTKNAHRIAILTGETEWTPMSGPLDDLQFVEQRKLSTAEIARVFRVPPWMIGASSGDSMTYSNTEQQALAFVSYSLRPWLVVIEQALSTDSDLCPGSLYVEFLLDALLRADSKTRAEVYAMALDPVTGWMNRSEVRRLENLEPEVPDRIPLEEMIA
ncbi:MAG: phage portal protein [Actinobacteria bacterium]|nr:phage portal protein [Actinomycetota bacterium]